LIIDYFFMSFPIINSQLSAGIRFDFPWKLCYHKKRKLAVFFVIFAPFYHTILLRKIIGWRDFIKDEFLTTKAKLDALAGV